MNHVIPFLLANWPLSLTALILIIIIFVMELRGLSLGVNLIGPNKAAILMNKKNCQVIDVRSTEAYASGHIKQARNMSLAQIKADSTLLKFKQDPILLICDHGYYSKKAGSYLRSQGFEQVYAIEGGLTQWRKENYPVSKS
jgi:rhodanese-related sulfurtransferase